MLRLNWPKLACTLSGCLLAVAIAAPAQTFKTLVDFDGTNGANPSASPIQGTDGNLYGTTSDGGAFGSGTVFKISWDGTLTTLYSFCAQTNCPDGSGPGASLVLGVDGNYYGTTFLGGLKGSGTVYKISPAGVLTTLYNFCPLGNTCEDGEDPYGALALGPDGNFYGTTTSGGGGSGSCSTNGAPGCGTVFKITPAGVFTKLHSFNFTDGAYPTAAMIVGTDGNLYGTTSGGGTSNSCLAYGCGTVYKITPSGTLTTLHDFDSTDGDQPWAPLVQASDGILYGTAAFGSNSSCVEGCGTAFKITLQDHFEVLHSFNGTDGEYPQSALIQATDGNLYGTAYEGGANFDGTIFKMTPNGLLTTLHSFDATDGARPLAPLVQATNGRFYGTTYWSETSKACAAGCGTVFGLSMGLGSFVETVPSSGRAGRPVIILGTSFTGATSVTFNGTPATFTVQSPTAIKTIVPTGATTGPVQVVTPSGTLTSNVNFQVLP